MSWAASLIRISTYEVETLQKRLAAIGDRRAAQAALIGRLDVEAAMEAATANDAGDLYSLLAHASFAKALAERRAQAAATLATIDLEAEGARDALNAAFEAQKRYEHVADLAAAAAARETRRRETAALDELGLRRLATR